MNDLKNKIEKSLAVKKLLEYKKQGYLFHGSDKGDIQILEPRQAKDESGDEYSIDEAIFAGTDPSTASIMGIITYAINFNHDPSSVCSINRDRDDRRTVLEVSKKLKDDIEKSKGFVYVLPSDTFDLEDPNQWQTKSHKSVKPIDIIEVNLQDYIELGGKVIWKE